MFVFWRVLYFGLFPNPSNAEMAILGWLPLLISAKLRGHRFGGRRESTNPSSVQSIVSGYFKTVETLDNDRRKTLRIIASTILKVPKGQKQKGSWPSFLARLFTVSPPTSTIGGKIQWFCCSFSLQTSQRISRLPNVLPCAGRKKVRHARVKASQ